MSEENRVMPVEVASNATLGEVTPLTGKGALGTWRISGDARPGTQSPAKDVMHERMSSLQVNYYHKG